jgi:hypothetical protein
MVLAVVEAQVLLVEMAVEQTVVLVVTDLLLLFLDHQLLTLVAVVVAFLLVLEVLEVLVEAVLEFLGQEQLLLDQPILVAVAEIVIVLAQVALAVQASSSFHTLVAENLLVEHILQAVETAYIHLLAVEV